jgi:hypothetical protein
VMSAHSATCIRGAGDSLASFAAWLGSARHHSGHHPLVHSPFSAGAGIAAPSDRSHWPPLYRLGWFVKLGKEGQKILLVAGQQGNQISAIAVSKMRREFEAAAGGNSSW